jgi:hypothetical protein
MKTNIHHAPIHHAPFAFIGAIMILAMTAWPMLEAHAASIMKAPPPAKFQSVHKLLGLPDFLPGLGTLYVDPATAPAGPFLGYDHKHRLVNVTYMIPLKDMDAHKNFENLGESVAGTKVNHVDINYNPGHAGVAEPHYHITLWFISAEEQAKIMQ